jgi:hypothetical protein
MEAHNPNSDPLRAALMRLATAPAATTPAQAPAAVPQGSAPPAVITPGPGGPATPRVQTESLPSPPRGGTR